MFRLLIMAACLPIFLSSGYLSAEYECWHRSCRTSNEDVQCWAGARCEAFKGSLNCAAGSVCTGYWAPVVECSGNSVCIAYYTGDSTHACPANDYYHMCRAEAVSKPSNESIRDFFKLILDKDVQSIDGCIYGPEPYDDMPGTFCYFDSINPHHIAAVVNGFVVDGAFSCGIHNGDQSKCRIEDFGFFPFYKKIDPDLNDAPSNTEIFKYFNSSSNAYIGSVKKCISGTFSDEVYRDGFYCTFEKLEAAQVQQSLNNAFGFKTYSCTEKNSEILCTITSKSALQVVYMAVKNTG